MGEKGERRREMERKEERRREKEGEGRSERIETWQLGP